MVYKLNVSLLLWWSCMIISFLQLYLIDFKFISNVWSMFWMITSSLCHGRTLAIVSVQAEESAPVTLTLRGPCKSCGLSAQDALSSSKSSCGETETVGDKERGGGLVRDLLQGPERGHSTTHPHFSGLRPVLRHPAPLLLTHPSLLTSLWRR